MLSKKRILELFNELDIELQKKNIHGDLFIVGGAATSGGLPLEKGESLFPRIVVEEPNQ